MKLLQSFVSGSLRLKNRMVMAAMTRSRANLDGTANDLMLEYYTQRASAGLILSEAINISPDAIGSPMTPGLWTDAQIQSWQKITAAVHQAGSTIFAQLWHTGRVGHSIDRQGKKPLAPSAIKIEGMQQFTSQGLQDFEMPQEMTLEQIQQTQQDYVQAAQNAIQAGFDGVEIHAANGYLPQQFFADSSNQRTDEYGGSVANRAKFTLEVVASVAQAIGADKVGIKISPLHTYAGIAFANPLADYEYLLNKLNELDIAFVEIMRRMPMFPAPEHYPQIDEVAYFSKKINNTVIAGSGYNQETGEAVLQNETADLVAFGVAFLANPDLPRRFAENAPLNTPDRNTLFGGSEKGYTDYPFLP